MLFILTLRPFLNFFCFPNVMMYALNIFNALKKITIYEIRDFIFENYCINELNFLKKRVIIQSNIRKKIYNFLQLNEQKKYLILVMLKNIINYL